MSNISKEKNNRPIGVFDSGVGGLSVLRELKKMLPNEDFVFFADQSHLPYGEKSKKELVERSLKITNYFIKNYDIKMLILACNTATSNTIKELRQRYSFPIVGTIPAVKVAAEKTKTKNIAVMATIATSKSKALKKLIKDYCFGVNTLNVGCRGLVDVVEEGELNGKKVGNLLLKYLKIILKSNVDYLVLGCTHYPFLKKSIQKIVGNEVELLDSGKAIAKQTRFLLLKHKIKNKNTSKKGRAIYLTTGNPLKFSKVSSLLLETKIKAKKIKT